MAVGPSIGRTLSEQILAGAANAKRHSPQSSSASSEGNDDAAMAVIMSLLEVNFINISRIHWITSKHISG